MKQAKVLVNRAATPLRSKLIFLETLKSNRGFTIIEILVAMFLVIIVLSLALSDPSSTNDLHKESDNLERAIRFMGDETALRNAVIRLHFILNKTPQEYAVEYGPSDSFVLPPEIESESASLSKEEEEKALKLDKSTNMKFNKVQEFQESNAELAQEIKIIGVGSTHSHKLKTGGETSIYAFPTGEKDDALILLANDEAVIALEVKAFTQKIEKTSYKIENKGNRELADIQAEKAKEIFEKWKRDN